MGEFVRLEVTYKINSQVSGENKSCRRETYSATSRFTVQFILL